MTFSEIKELLELKFGNDAFSGVSNEDIQPVLIVRKEFLLLVCTELYTNCNTYFDFLSSVTGIDNGAEKGTMEIVYHIYSIPLEHHFAIKIELPRNKPDEPLPVAPSVVGIWKTANWQEREVYDMFGIKFEGHPDLRRILLPEDWEGFPLKKDYQAQEYYHGIKVKY